MFSVNQITQVQPDEDVWESLMQLKANIPEKVLSQRNSVRLELRVPVLMRPGNPSERHVEPISAISADISEGGCQIITDQPIWVGNFMLLEFDRCQLNIDPITARCLRCCLLTDQEYECGFKFTSTIKIDQCLS